jgi:hypothetical protein
MPKPPPVDLKNRQLALLLAWMVPGLGHYYQGRISKGILYSVCILGLFGVGLFLGDGRIVYWRWQYPMSNPETFCFPYLFQFWTGLPAVLGIVQATLLHYSKDFILWGFMAEPTQTAINSLYPKGKLAEIGTLYTMVAGLLNVLAMYDAYEGPAHIESDPTTPVPVVPASKPEVNGVGTAL